MGYRNRRRLDVVLLGLFCLVVGGIAAAAAAIGDTERIEGYWVSAVVADGQAEIAEVIDYDFGSAQRHGIFRRIDDVEPDAIITVSSPTAPDQADVQYYSSFDRDRVSIRIGDPNRTISGRHRYRIRYPLAVGQPDGPILWDAIGTGWEVGMRDIEIHLAGTTDFTDFTCSTGQAGSWGGCTLTQVEPGHLVVTIDELEPGEGVTIGATPGAALPGLAEWPTQPTGAAVDPGVGLLPIAGLTLAASVLAAAATSRRVRREGREQVWAGGSADAAFGPQFGQEFPTRLVDHGELAELASTEFAPPKALNAWQGGVLHKEGTGQDQKVAWLLERAIDGQIQIDGATPDGEGDLTLVRLPVDATPSDQGLLDGIFGSRTSVALDEYDPQFAAGWATLETELDRWQRESRFWDPAGDRRRGRALGVGVIAVLLGAIVGFPAAALANRSGGIWLIGVGLGAAILGTGLALFIRGWELRVRTPEGSGLWILVESFRRFIEGSEARHVQDAAEQGRLREYTAWATALGEADHWSDAVGDAELDNSIDTSGLYLAALAPRLGSVTSSAATAPSSSGSGGGGSVGGGSGGGGGGSW